VLIKFLQENRNIITWKPADISEVPRELIEHELHLDPTTKPVKQRLHHFTQDKKDVIKGEITRLLYVSFIKEVYHMNWLANPVLVPKKNKDWSMCVDYTDLEKACKKDPFGLPRIDQVVDSTAGSSLLCFLDCYSGIIKFPSKSKIRSRHLSSLGSVLFVPRQCHSDSKVQVQHTKGAYKGVHILNLGAVPKHTLMTWSLRLEKTKDSSLT
jgi:hypothetical protein